ncbi:hypothetical protein CXB51_033516 [Gossypium anomalum]|uniref:Uncharacterized protein n=1 Tax=Gossypium anomalum TaxID=47600 RepID=A0A8J6CLD6_9ROSI|nr:hypothetical protein CXB51_033516 [Gossypium anomalum]
MEAALAELERVQLQILRRISKLELSHLPQNAEPISSSSPLTNGDASSDVEACLSNILRSNGVNDFIFKRVASDYYDWPLESRRDVLGAASVHHLCKSIVLVCHSTILLRTDNHRSISCMLHTEAALLAQVNTQAPSNVIDCSDRNNSKYYVVVVQYTARFNAETVKNFLYTLNNGKISKKKFNLRLAPEETSIKLTGYEHNAVTCIGMQTDIPVSPLYANLYSTPLRSLSFCRKSTWGPEDLIAWVILDEAIVKLDPDFFWLGGGEVDLKLGIRTSEFINFVKPFIVSCSGDSTLQTVVWTVQSGLHFIAFNIRFQRAGVSGGENTLSHQSVHA